ncbi:unnamed protein product, partial [Protopolystoma xenopodis]
MRPRVTTFLIRNRNYANFQHQTVDLIHAKTPRSLIFALTPEAQLLLSLLLHLLTEVGSHCDKNCMSPYSLAVCWAPNLVPDSSEPADVRLIEWLISHARLLLRVPAQWTKTLKPEVESLNTTADNTSTTSVLASSGVPIETGLYDDYEEIDLDDDDDNYREQEGQTRKREKVRRRSHHLGITLNSSPYAPRMGSNSEGAWFAHHINPTVGSEGAGNWATPAMMSSGDSSVSNSNSKIGRNCIGFPFQPSEEAFPTAAWRPLLRKMSTAPSRSSCLSADLINLRQISEAADKRWKILLANCNLPCLLLLARLRSLCQLGLTSNTLIGTADSSHTGLVADGPTPPTTWLDQLGWSAQRGSAPRTVHISRQLHAPADELASSREFRGKDAAAESEDEEEDEEDEEEQQEEMGFVDFSTYSWFSDIAFMTAMEQAKAGTP